MENEAILSLSIKSTCRFFSTHRKNDTLPWIWKSGDKTFTEGNHRFLVPGFILLLSLLILQIESMRDRSSSSEDEIMLDAITVESPPQLGLWEFDFEDQIYPPPMR